jgi:hypothetical protein
MCKDCDSAKIIDPRDYIELSCGFFNIRNVSSGNVMFLSNQNQVAVLDEDFEKVKQAFKARGWMK